MTVSEFCGLCTEGLAPIRIYDLNDEVSRDIWKGDIKVAERGEYRDYELCSFDLNEVGITLNIDTSEE